jgi:hypothetical protein
MGTWLRLWPSARHETPSVAACRARRLRDWADESAAKDGSEDSTPPCGWFESSFELQRGLAVRELQGTVRRRPVATVAGQAAAPAWGLT